MALLFWIGREGTTFLGDSQYMLHRIESITRETDIPVAIPHEPLTAYVVWHLFRLLSSLGIEQAHLRAYEILSIGCGLIFILVLRALVRELAERPAERLALFLFVLSLGSVQYCFGYVENYSPAYVGLFGYLLLALRHLRGRVPLWAPSALLGLLIVFYFGMVVGLVSLGVLWVNAVRKREWAAIAAAIPALVLTVAGALWLCNYPEDRFLSLLLGSESHILQITHLTSAWQGYTLFSIPHLIDLLNFQILLGPFLLLLLAFVMVRSWHAIPRRDPKWLFLLSSAATGLGMMLVFSCDIGMSRDWDLLGTFSPGLVAAGGYAACRFLPKNERRLLLLLGLATLLHTIPWVVVNANTERALSRFDVLLSTPYWGANAYKVNEELAIFHRQYNTQAAIVDYRRFLVVDSTNDRIWMKLADQYEAIDRKDSVLYCCRKAIQYGTMNWRPYIILGYASGSQGNYDQAISLLLAGVRLNPRYAAGLVSAGEYYLQWGEQYREALPLFLRAIEIDATIARAYWNAASCYAHLRENDLAEVMLQTYLRLRPNDGAKVEELRKGFGH
jgi:Flp pilus assembly protein TadD